MTHISDKNKVRIPEKAIIDKGKYVYCVTERSYSKEKKYTSSKRVCIGKKVSETEMVPNTRYYELFQYMDHEPETNITSDVLKIGVSCLADKTVEQYTGKNQILSATEKEQLGFLLTEHRYADMQDYCFEHVSASSKYKVLSETKQRKLLTQWNKERSETDRLTISLIPAKEDTDDQQTLLTVVSADDGRIPLICRRYENNMVTQELIQNVISEKDSGKDITVIGEKEFFSEERMKYLNDHQIEYILNVKLSSLDLQHVNNLSQYKRLKTFSGIYEQSIQDSAETNKYEQSLFAYYDAHQAEKRLFPAERKEKRRLEETIPSIDKTNQLFLLASSGISPENALQQYDRSRIYQTVMFNTRLDAITLFLSAVIKNRLYDCADHKHLWSFETEKKMIALLEQIFITRNHSGQYCKTHSLSKEQAAMLKKLDIEPAYLNGYIKRINDRF